MRSRGIWMGTEAARLEKQHAQEGNNKTDSPRLPMEGLGRVATQCFGAKLSSSWQSEVLL